MKLQYRFSDWDYHPDKQVSADDLFDGSIFDYYAICTADEKLYDLLKGMELIRGEQIYDLHLVEQEKPLRTPVVYIKPSPELEL